MSFIVVAAIFSAIKTTNVYYGMPPTCKCVISNNGIVDRVV